MKLHELRALVNNQSLDPYLDVILSKDSEGIGNSFSPLADLGLGYYHPDCSRCGEFIFEESFEEEAKYHKENSEDNVTFTVNAVCFLPLN